MDFKVSFEGFTMISEKMPEEITACILIWKNHRGEYTISFGGYDEDTKQFYVDYGFGGMVLELENVIAWKDLEDFKLETIE